VNDLSDDDLCRIEPAELVRRIVDEHCAGFIAPDLEAKALHKHVFFPSGESERQLSVTLEIPCRGAVGVLHQIQPRLGHSTGGSSGDNPKGHVKLHRTCPERQAEQLLGGLGPKLQQWLQTFMEHVERANDLISAHRREVADVLAPVVEVRRRHAELFRETAASLSVPLSIDSNPAPIPVSQTATNMQRIDASREDGALDWRLEEQIAEDVIGTIRAFANALERMPSTANQLLSVNEESVRDVLLFALNANYKGAAVAEAFSGYGKTDVLLRWQDRDAFIGECKIWNGSARLGEAVSQLLERYTIWRDTRVALIVFFRSKRATDAIASAQDAVHRHPQYCGKLPSDEPERRQDFFMNSIRDSGRTVRLALLPVVLSPVVSAD